MIILAQFVPAHVIITIAVLRFACAASKYDKAFMARVSHRTFSFWGGEEGGEM